MPEQKFYFATIRSGGFDDPGNGYVFNAVLDEHPLEYLALRKDEQDEAEAQGRRTKDTTVLFYAEITEEQYKFYKED